MDTVYLENQEMRGVPLILLDNKCDGHGNQGSTYFVKLVAQMDEVRDRIKVTCIWIQGADNSTVEAAAVIDCALKVYDYIDSLVQFSGYGTDAGGSGTQEDLLQKLVTLDRVCNLGECVWTTCSLHGLNIYLSLPTTMTMVEGGLLNFTALQLLHLADSLS